MRSRSNASCPKTGWSPWAVTCCWPRRSSAAARSASESRPTLLLFFDLDTRELLRTRPNPLNHDKIIRLRGNRPAGPPPRPSLEPIRVQRRVSHTGVITVCLQKVALGRIHARQTVTVIVSETTLTIELDDGESRVVRRTTTTAVRNIKANQPRPVSSGS